MPSISTEEVIVVPPVDPPKPPPPDPDPGLPFVWPPEYHAAVDPAARYAWWWLVPGKTEWDIDGKAYALLRLSKGASGAFEALLHGGKLKLNDGVYDFDETKRGAGS